MARRRFRSPVRLGIQRRTGWGYAYVTLWIGNRGFMRNVRWLRER